MEIARLLRGLLHTFLCLSASTPIPHPPHCLLRPKVLPPSLSYIIQRFRNSLFISRVRLIDISLSDSPLPFHHHFLLPKFEPHSGAFYEMNVILRLHSIHYVNLMKTVARVKVGEYGTRRFWIQGKCGIFILLSQPWLPLCSGFLFAPNKVVVS